MLKFIILATVAIAATTAAPAVPSEAKAASPENSTVTPRPLPTVLPPGLIPPLVPDVVLPDEVLIGSESRPARSPAFAKALSTITEIKTPASTTKLAQLVAPLATPLAAAPILSPLQPVPAYAYALPSLPSIELAAAPSTYSIEQHGYRIIY